MIGSSLIVVTFTITSKLSIILVVALAALDPPNF